MNERDKELVIQVYGSKATIQELHFAELIRADERDRAMRENAYVQLEREACAVMADECANIEELGAAIRARGNK